MKIKYFQLFVIFAVALLILSACGGGESNTTPTSGAGGTNPDRPEPPAEYQGKTNPYQGDQGAVTAGKTIYQTNCATCHGESGQGDGPSAAALNPHPTNLAANQAGFSDAYLFWRISEGGIDPAFASSMPPWKGVLTEEQIWQVISYIRTLQ